ncbi:MAG: DUF366 family protein [Deltaproteobacteria bacterium]|nr:DUF366 family protein [Deltaproteobacteria bacterium]
MKGFEVHWVDEKLTYDGTQLSPLWIYKNFNLCGDAMVSFEGPADVSLHHMVDLEDVKAKRPIFSQSMVHFLAEFFDLDLEKTVYRQRLLIVIVKEILEAQLGRLLQRKGDDIYDGQAKLSVSIATLSQVSSLIHAGINVISEGTPIPTRGLKEYQMDPKAFAKAVLTRFQEELQNSWFARCKVRCAN